MSTVITVVTVSRLDEDGTTEGVTYNVPVDWPIPIEFGDPIQRTFLPSLPERTETIPMLEQLGGLIEDIDG